jgi:hypothetical protein
VHRGIPTALALATFIAGCASTVTDRDGVQPDAAADDGLPACSPPRRLRPLAAHEVTSNRPTFQWVDPGSSVSIEVCRYRDCAAPEISARAASGWRPSAALAPGPHFWRIRSEACDRWSAPWAFHVRFGETGVDTHRPVLGRDDDGDGAADLLVQFNGPVSRLSNRLGGLCEPSMPPRTRNRRSRRSRAQRRLRWRWRGRLAPVWEWGWRASRSGGGPFGQ